MVGIRSMLAAVERNKAHLWMLHWWRLYPSSSKPSTVRVLVVLLNSAASWGQRRKRFTQQIVYCFVNVVVIMPQRILDILIVDRNGWAQNSSHLGHTFPQADFDNDGQHFIHKFQTGAAYIYTVHTFVVRGYLSISGQLS